MNPTKLIDLLMSLDFPGKGELLQQLATATMKHISEYTDNYGSAEIVTSVDAPASVNFRVPVEATGYDKDGVPINVLLHVVEGKAKELEIIKADGSPIIKMPSLSEFTVKVTK